MQLSRPSPVQLCCKTKTSPLATKNAVTTILKRIENYIQYVDHNDFEQALGIFADNAVYERGNWPPLKGKEAIRTFYLKTRQLKGKHNITPGCSTLKPHPLGTSITLKGRFTGFNGNKPIDITFKDFWIFDKHYKAIYRKT